jgi:hypothetical protein
VHGAFAAGCVALALVHAEPFLVPGTVLAVALWLAHRLPDPPAPAPAPAPPALALACGDTGNDGCGSERGLLAAAAGLMGSFCWRCWTGGCLDLRAAVAGLLGSFLAAFHLSATRDGLGMSAPLVPLILLPAIVQVRRPPSNQPTPHPTIHPLPARPPARPPARCTAWTHPTTRPRRRPAPVCVSCSPPS